MIYWIKNGHYIYFWIIKLLNMYKFINLFYSLFLWQMYTYFLTFLLFVNALFSKLKVWRHACDNANYRVRPITWFTSINELIHLFCFAFHLCHFLSMPKDGGIMLNVCVNMWNVSLKEEYIWYYQVHDIGY